MFTPSSEACDGNSTHWQSGVGVTRDDVFKAQPSAWHRVSGGQALAMTVFIGGDKTDGPGDPLGWRACREKRGQSAVSDQD